MKNTNKNNKNTGQFYVVTAKPDGTMGLVNTGNFDETFKCASELCRHGHLDRGIYLLKILAGLRPDDPQVLAELAYALIVKNDPGPALKFVERLKLHRPDEALTSALLGMACKRLGRESEATMALEKALSATFTGIESIRAVIALSMMLNKRISEAERLVHKIQATDPNDQFAWLALGNIRHLQGNKSEAIDAFNEAIAISPSTKLGQAALNCLLALQLDQNSDPKNN